MYILCVCFSPHWADLDDETADEYMMQHAADGLASPASPASPVRQSANESERAKAQAPGRVEGVGRPDRDTETERERERDREIERDREKVRQRDREREREWLQLQLHDKNQMLSHVAPENGEIRIESGRVRECARFSMMLCVYVLCPRGVFYVTDVNQVIVWYLLPLATPHTWEGRKAIHM